MTATMLKLTIIFSFLVISGCAVMPHTNMNLNIKPPDIGDCEKIPDLWEKSKVELNISCSI